MSNAALAAFGRGILRAAPWLMKLLALAGTSGDVPGRWRHPDPRRPRRQRMDRALRLLDAARIPGAGTVLGALMPTLANAAVGIIAGGLVVLVVKLFERLRAKPGATH